mgnify:FL=1
MAKNLEISLLLDFYGDMITEKQRDVVELYYNEDLSLAEIAAHSQITRQGVRDSIKRAEGILLDLEERLGLAKKFRQIQDGLDEMAACARQIQAFNARHGNFQEVSAPAARIVELAGKLND